MNELTKVKIRILDRLITYAKDMEKAGALTNDIKVVIGTVKLIVNSEFERTANEQLHTEHIIKSTIKEYIDKEYDDVTELLLTLSKDLCERIKHEDEKATAAQLKTECSRKEKEPRLSKPAFTVIDHVLKEHEEHEDRFTTFCDGRHQQITVKQINAELDKLYNYFYGKGEESGKGTK